MNLDYEDEEQPESKPEPNYDGHRDPLMMTYFAGFMAYHDGAPIEDNPFEVKSYLFNRWRQGFFGAADEDEEEELVYKMGGEFRY